MYTKMLAVLCLALFWHVGVAHALSDAEYQSLVVSSPEFKQADHELSKVWQEVYGQLKGPYKKEVMDGQRQWVRTGRDASAREFMASGLNWQQAYTKAVRSRINALRVIQHNNGLSPEGIAAGRAKADGYYDAVQDDSEATQKQGTDLHMTLEEFFAPKNKNVQLAAYVMGQSEAGGVQGQLDRAKYSLSLVSKESDPGKKEAAAKLAWFFAVHSAYLADTTVPKAEAGPYKKAATEVLVGAIQVLGIPKPDLENLIKGTAQLFGEAEKQMAEGDAEESSSKTSSRPQPNTEAPKLPREEFSRQYFYSQKGCTGNIRFLENDGLGRVEIQTSCGSSTCDADYNITNILYSGPSRIIELADATGRTNRLVSKHGYILENNDSFYCGNGGMMKGEYLDQSIYGSNFTQKKDIPSSEEQKIATLLQIAKTAPAQSEKARGRAFPVLTANAQAYKRLDRELANAMIKHRDSIMSKDVFIQQKGVAKAWEDIGYSLDATFRGTFSQITPDQNFNIRRDGTMNLFLITSQLFQEEKTLKEALERGLISRDSAVAYLSSTQRLMAAMKQAQ